MKIYRTLLWFKDGNEMIVPLNEQYFGLSNLLNRLLNEYYNGPAIKFINIDFATQETYELHPELPRNTSYYYNKHLRYYGSIDLKLFNSLDSNAKNLFLWKNAVEYLELSAIAYKNKELSDASKYAYKAGLKKNLNPDYKLVDCTVNVHGQKLNASIWIHFTTDKMYSKLVLEKEGKLIFERNIDETRSGVEFF